MTFPFDFHRDTAAVVARELCVACECAPWEEALVLQQIQAHVRGVVDAAPPRQSKLGGRNPDLHFVSAVDATPPNAVIVPPEVPVAPAGGGAVPGGAVVNGAPTNMSAFSPAYGNGLAVYGRSIAPIAEGMCVCGWVGGWLCVCVCVCVRVCVSVCLCVCVCGAHVY